MMQHVKLTLSPFTSNIETAGDIILSIHVPYSESSVTVQVNPNIHEYQENADSEDVNVRQVMVSTSTDQTRKLSFDFKQNRKQTVEINGHTYTIELLNIGKEQIEGQEFFVFEFQVADG